MVLLASCRPLSMPKDPSASVFSPSNSFKHNIGVVVGMECKACHENKRPKETPPHGQGNDCKGCHNPAGWKFGASSFDHSKVMDRACGSCHELKRPISNPPHGGGADCKACHVPGGGWLIGVSNPHSPTPSGCAGCHGPGGVRNSLPALHIGTQGSDCKTCHHSTVGSYISWQGGQYNHAPEPTNCGICHDDGQARDSFPPGHIATGGADCKGCHQSSIPGYLAWAGGIQNHNPTPANCSICHGDGAPRDSFPATHISIQGQDCKSCHQPSISGGYLNWTGAAFSHSPEPVSCASCHATEGTHPSFPTNHIPTQGLDCKSCHQASLTNFTNWTGGIQNHSPTPNNCGTCHAAGAIIDRFPTNHIPTSGKDCKICHGATITSGYGNWRNGVYGHDPAPAACTSCHSTGGIRPSYPAVHISTVGKDCKACHQASVTASYANWTSGVYGHTPAPSNCAGCHADNAVKDSFPAGHIAVNGLDCKSCHQASVTGNYGNWTGGVFSHNPEPATCKTCHADGASRDSFPVGHITVGTLDCKACHQATLTNYTSWAGAIFNHNPVPATCGSCHSDGAPYDRFPPVHVPTSGNDCVTCHSSSIAGGFANWQNGQYSHSPAPSSCASCHSPGGLHNSLPTDHFATNGVDCKSCHVNSVNNGYADWFGGIFSHTTTIINQKNCNSCHNTNRPTIGKLMAQDPALTVNKGHYGQFDCYYCHKTTNQFKDWNSSATSHYNASGTKVESCLPCHYSRKSPSFNQTGSTRISPHTSTTSYFTPPIYDINAVGNAPGANGKLGKCFSCHTKRRSFD